MSVARVTEITCSSTSGFEDAIREGIARATKTLENVTGAWIKGHEVVINNARVTEYRVRLKVTFILND
ncbi:MAG TPA: dodecin family protein [Candidatus Krumholzibacteria bacterium]|nr:dodecin family protein [Candidatus Krumholzibacteria bacterium]